MYFLFDLSVFLLYITLAIARQCGTGPPSLELQDAHVKYAILESKQRKRKPSKTADDPLIHINTYLHIITSGDSIDQGNVPQQQVFDQIDTLNRDYSGSGFWFDLLTISWVNNTDWQGITEFTPEDYAMKSSLRQGSYNSLNIYLTRLDNGLLGYAYFPETVTSINDFAIDGVVADYRTVPGGSYAPEFGLGRTVTHESGHWFGLLHTFQGGCPPPGDYVNDTAPEASPAFGCPEGRDTCIDDQGPDPIHNYMDYSDDSCMNNFTPGQILRMNSLWQEFRANYTGPTLPSTTTGPSTRTCAAPRIKV